MKKNNGSSLLLIMILLSVVLGIFSGLFFGEWCAHLKIVGQAFIALMQVSVLPYIFVSLIQSFGCLEPAQAKSLAKRGIIMVLALWAVVFALMTLMPMTFPDWQSSSFFSPSILKGENELDYIKLFIPANPFNALANNVVPAVTLFSIMCGVVLMGIPRKKNLLDLLEISGDVLSRLTLLLVKLSPIGIFALVADAAGTMYPEDLGRLAVYLATFLAMGGLLFFAVLPLLLTAFTPFKYRELMAVSRTAMLTVLLTGNLFIVLPLLVENTKKLFELHRISNEDSRNMAKIIIPITFILPCAGQLMDLLFILFSAWFSNIQFGPVDYLKLYGTGTLTLFGNAKVAIPFLLSIFQLPADLFELFTISSVVTDNVKFAVEAFAVFCFSALFAAWMTGKASWSWRKLAPRLTIIGIVTALVLAGLTCVLATVVRPPADQRQTLDAMRLQNTIDTAVFDTLPPPQPPEEGSHLDRIRRDKVLRVGSNMNIMPFAFFNSRHELIGLDIEMAHQLADDLGCTRIEFYPVSFDDPASPLDNNQVDIVMSNLSISAGRLGKLAFTEPYLELSLALVVLDYRKNDLVKNPELFMAQSFGIAALAGADFDRLKQYLPHHLLFKITSYDEFFSGKCPAKALMTTAETGSAWTILHPEYDLFIPKRQIHDIIAYGIVNGDARFLEYMNLWLKLKRLNGEIDRGYDYWIKGINVQPKPARWSILNNVIRKKH